MFVAVVVLENADDDNGLSVVVTVLLGAAAIVFPVLEVVIALMFVDFGVVSDADILP